MLWLTASFAMSQAHVPGGQGRSSSMATLNSRPQPSHSMVARMFVTGMASVLPGGIDHTLGVEFSWITLGLHLLKKEVVAVGAKTPTGPAAWVSMGDEGQEAATACPLPQPTAGRVWDGLFGADDGQGVGQGALAVGS